jgi:LmbE family N-acetylglucosaminyl deacetylase
MVHVMPDDWTRMLAVVAHPDDLEYSAASAVARWTGEERQVSYLLVTRGEAGIHGLDPGMAGPLREDEQRNSARLVGVDDVTFLDHADGTVQYTLELRRDIARHIRRVRPHVVLTTTGETTFGERSVNHADHRHVALAVLDAGRDAANRWIHPELLDEGLDPWNGLEYVYAVGATEPTHGVDVTAWVDAGIASLSAHSAYLAGLAREFDPSQFVRSFTAQMGAQLGVHHAVTFERFQLAGV